VIVAVVAVRVVQVAVDEVVDVIAMRHRLVPAARPVLMPRLVPLAAMLGCAAVGVLVRHLDHVLVDVIVVRMMQVTVVQVVDVILMANGGVTAIGAVAVRMALVMGI
jgi:hypothetical protein